MIRKHYRYDDQKNDQDALKSSSISTKIIQPAGAPKPNLNRLRHQIADELASVTDDMVSVADGLSSIMDGIADIAGGFVVIAGGNE